MTNMMKEGHLYYNKFIRNMDKASDKFVIRLGGRLKSVSGIGPRPPYTHIGTLTDSLPITTQNMTD
jgi:hypothetical protein